jgi:hypothetical protein
MLHDKLVEKIERKIIYFFSTKTQMEEHKERSLTAEVVLALLDGVELSVILWWPSGTTHAYVESVPRVLCGSAGELTAV